MVAWWPRTGRNPAKTARKQQKNSQESPTPAKACINTRIQPNDCFLNGLACDKRPTAWEQHRPLWERSCTCSIGFLTGTSLIKQNGTVASRLNVLRSPTLPPPALHPICLPPPPPPAPSSEAQQDQSPAQLKPRHVCQRRGGGATLEGKIKCVYKREGEGRGGEVITTTHGDRWKRGKEGRRL